MLTDTLSHVMTTLDCIYIKNFTCPAHVGIYPHEKGITQPIVLHLEICGNWSKSHFLDYDKIIEKIHTVLAKQHYDLLESLADMIANTLLSDFPIQKLTLSIDKPQAVKQALVGIRIERSA